MLPPKATPGGGPPDEPPPTQAVILPPAGAAGADLGEAACLVMIAGPELGRKFNLAANRVVLGRSAQCDFAVEEESVSRSHAEITRTSAGYRIRDLGSTNGTRRNDQPVTGPQPLADGDLVGLGRVGLKFLTGANLERAYHEEILRQSTLDGLTQVGNRRHFDAQLERECARAQRHRHPLALVLFDLDHFKRINDTHGHPAGDHVLRMVGAAVRARVRAGDLLARYGGEEFALLLPETDLAGARLVAEKVRAAVAGLALTHGGERIPVTLSAGVAATDGRPPDGAALLRGADEQLYAAKRAGRNRVSG